MLSVDVRVVFDKDDLLAVNLDDKPGGNAVPELPSERNSSTLEVVFVYFAGYGKLSKRDGRLSSRNNDNVVPIGRIEGKGCPIVAP